MTERLHGARITRIDLSGPEPTYTSVATITNVASEEIALAVGQGAREAFNRAAIADGTGGDLAFRLEPMTGDEPEFTEPRLTVTVNRLDGEGAVKQMGQYGPFLNREVADEFGEDAVNAWGEIGRRTYVGEGVWHEFVVTEINTRLPEVPEY